MKSPVSYSFLPGIHFSFNLNKKVIFAFRIEISFQINPRRTKNKYFFACLFLWSEESVRA